MPTAIRTVRPLQLLSIRDADDVFAIQQRRQGQTVDGRKQSTTTVTTQENPKTKQQQSSKTATVLSHDQALMNLQQSNQIVKTMLDATFGCMTFLRGLLPEGNFEDVQIAAPEPGPGLRADLDESAAPASQNNDDSYGGSQVKGGKGLRIKKIKRGYSPEADKLLDWIDVGVLEAVEKQYLKSCVFAVYLDPEDPTNLVEALTINFHYPEVSNSGVKVPQFEIEDSIHNLHIGGSTGLAKSTDSARGPDGMNLRSIGEVKRAIRKLIKSLIITCQSLGELPARRWVTMRLEYLDSTPQEYEPPFFVAAGNDQKLHFSTKDASQVPDKTAVGHLDTGFHSLSLKITSITEFIPRALSIEEEEETYGGFAASADKSYDIGKKRRAEEAALRSDSAKRRVVWSALDNVEDRADIDPSYQDAEGEPDSQIPNRIPDSPSARPIGIRQADGTILPCSQSSQGVLAAKLKSAAQDNMRSSQLDPTYISNGLQGPDNISPNGWTPNSNEDPHRAMKKTQPETIVEGTQSEAMLHPATSALAPDGATHSQSSDVEMRSTSDNEAAEKIPATEESIDSFHDPTEKQLNDILKEASPTKVNRPNRPRRSKAAPHGAVEANGQAKDQMCPCAANVEDEVMVQCEGCSVWYHIPCAGYLEEADLPEKYECIICRLELAGKVSAQEIANVRNYLPSLTLERRALKKMYKKSKFENVHNLQREVGCDMNDFRNLLERFAEMGFLKIVVSQVSRKINARQRRMMEIKTFHTQDDPKALKRYDAYFKPGGDVELRACGISEPSMAKQGELDQTLPCKPNAQETSEAPVEKENIDPKTCTPVRPQAPKPIALPKPSRPTNVPAANKPPAKAAKDADQSKTEGARKIISLPKSNPRPAMAKQTIASENAPTKGLFRTAASIVTQTVVSEEVVAVGANDEVTLAAAQTMQAGIFKASVPEEDVDMGF